MSVSFSRGRLRFEDSRDHFENGVLRLLGMDVAMFERWLDLAAASEGTSLEQLGRGFSALRPAPAGDASGLVDPGPYGEQGELAFPAIAESPSFGLAQSSTGDVGWLVRRAGARFVREITPPPYEEAYFEGDARSAGGYGSYAAQAGWRLEKAARMVRDVARATGLERGRVLDVGAGYGYFRVALERAGFEHEGIELSAHARDVARGLYGQATRAGTLDDHANELAGGFDLVTLWDVVEHVSDPAALLAAAARCLRPGGAIALKTPNLDCPEASVFGAHYHSLKREHLVVFTPVSIARVAAMAGLHVATLETHSHLLRGFVGDDEARAWERAGRGADLTAILHAS